MQNTQFNLFFRYRSISSFIILLFITATCYGQNDKSLEISVDSLVSPQFTGNQPGVSILVAKKGKIIYEKAFGSANIELNVAMQPDMVFRIGSITKQFTAIAILQLVEQGKISLQDSMQKYVKEFPSKGYTITIENLLTHTSGIRDYANADTVDPYSERKDYTPQQMINIVKNWPLEFKPGEKYNYSNSGYVLLGYIIEQVTGMSYHEYVKQHIIKPVGLNNTYYADENAIVPNRVTGYTRDKGYFQNCDYQTISIGYAAADLMSTIEDLYKWNNALLAYKLVKKETLQKAFMPFKLNNGTYTNYGYGWFTEDWHGKKCIHHEGQVSGFISEEKYFPQDDIYAVILTNLKSGEDKTDFSNNRFQLFDDVFTLALGEKLQKEINVNLNILNNYIGTYRNEQHKVDLKIYLENGKLYSDLSNHSGLHMVLSPQSNTIFFLPDIKRAHTTITFNTENGKVTGLTWIQQDEKLDLKKIK